MIGYGEISEPGLALSRKLGADLTINSQNEDAVGITKSQTHGLGADVVIETSGSTGGYKMILDLARQGGTVICVGLTGGQQVQIPMDRVALNELDVYGVRANPNSCDEVIMLLDKGKANFKPLITHTFPLAEFGKALEVFSKKTDGAIKVVIHP